MLLTLGNKKVNLIAARIPPGLGLRLCYVVIAASVHGFLRLCIFAVLLWRLMFHCCLVACRVVLLCCGAYSVVVCCRGGGMIRDELGLVMQAFGLLSNSLRPT